MGKLLRAVSILTTPAAGAFQLHTDLPAGVRLARASGAYCRTADGGAQSRIEGIWGPGTRRPGRSET
jgi:hypothetical protein